MYFTTLQEIAFCFVFFCFVLLIIKEISPRTRSQQIIIEVLSGSGVPAWSFCHFFKKFIYSEREREAAGGWRAKRKGERELHALSAQSSMWGSSSQTGRSRPEQKPRGGYWTKQTTQTPWNTVGRKDASFLQVLTQLLYPLASFIPKRTASMGQMYWV